MAVMVSMGGDGSARQYGLWEFPDDIDFPPFSASQLMEALTWANDHGHRIETATEE
jgi:hypothetical protein